MWRWLPSPALWWCGAARSAWEDISASQLRIVADLSNVMTVGSVSVPARVYLDYNSEVGVIGEYSVVVNISR